jgi:AraC family transcriptional regulator, ethanolamine operon transcriptional activator
VGGADGPPMDDTMTAGVGGGAVVRLETADPEEHTLFWRRNGSDNRFDQLSAGRFRGAIAAVAGAGGALAAATVDYNRLVRVRGGVEPHRLALVLDFAGHGQIPTLDGHLGPREAMVFGGGAEVDASWDAARFGVLSCNLDLARDAARRITGGDLVEPGYRELRAEAAPPVAALRRLKGVLRAVEDGTAGPWGPAATGALLEDAVLLLAAGAAPPRRWGAVASAARLRRAEEFLRAHAEEPIALAGLCGALGVPERTLRADFHARFGLGPIACLRRLRLNGARRALRQGRAGSVTEAAVEWGFYHLGEFAAAYQMLFGELPSETRRRSSGAPGSKPSRGQAARRVDDLGGTSPTPPAREPAPRPGSP